MTEEETTQQVEMGGMSNFSAADDPGEIIKAVLLGGRDSFLQGLSESNKDDQGNELGKATEAFSSAAITPPVDLDLLAACPTVSSRLSRCIRTYARNTGGFGWEIKPKQPVSEETSPEKKAVILTQTGKLQQLFSRPTPVPSRSFTKILELVCTDEETLGNGYLEVVRTLGGEIYSLIHVPGRTVRIIQDGQGFIQQRSGEIRYFKNFRDPRKMNAKTGQYAEDLPLTSLATELLHFRIDSVCSTWYGIPRWYPAIPAIAGNRFAAMRNVAFFANDACPRILITVTGGSLLDTSVNHLQEFFSMRGKGALNAHRVCILQAEPRRTGISGNSPVTITVEKLTVGVEDEASFKKYQEANEKEIRESFGIAEIFFAPSGSNRASAFVERQTTNEQEFEPARLEKEFLINNTLCLDVLSGGLQQELIPEEQVLVKFKLLRPSFTFPAEQADIHRIYAGSGVMTPNEIRQELGLPPFGKEATWANKPNNIAVTELQVSPAMAKAGMKPIVGEVIRPPEPPKFTPEETEEVAALKKFLEKKLQCQVELQLKDAAGRRMV